MRICNGVVRPPKFLPPLFRDLSGLSIWMAYSSFFSRLANDAILEYSGNNEVYNNTFVTGTWKAYISDSTTSLCYNNLIVGYNIAFENNASGNNPARYQANWLWQCTTATAGAGFTAERTLPHRALTRR